MRLWPKRKQPADEPAPTVERPGDGAPGPEKGEARAATPPAAGPVAGESPANLDGLRAWVAQIDRKLGARFYALAAASVLALATGIVAIILVLGVKDDSATNQQLAELRQELAGVEESATQAAQEDVAAIADRVGELESQLQGLRSARGSTEQEIEVLRDDVSELRDDISSLESAADNNPGSP